MAVLLAAAAAAAAAAALPPGAGCGECDLKRFRPMDADTATFGARDADLVSSRQMWGQLQSQCVRIPFDVYARTFSDPPSWCTWNGLFGPVKNVNVTVGSDLDAQFNVIPNVSWPNGTVLPPPHIKRSVMSSDYLEYAWIYQFSAPGDKVYEFGRHSYAAGAAGNGTCFMSWEKAAGPYLSPAVAQEVEHTLFCATKAATDGSRCLEEVYMRTGGLDPADVKAACHKWTGMGCDLPATDYVDCFRGTYPVQHAAN